MKVTARTRRALAFRRQARELTRRGYRCHETDWEIHRGGRQGERILDAVISTDGKYVYTKIGKPPVWDDGTVHQQEAAMKPDVIVQLQQALWSGDYDQIQGYPRTDDGYCVLGVLANISRLGRWERAAEPGRWNYRVAGDKCLPLPYQLVVWAGFDDGEIGTLVNWNDSGLTFAEIAARLTAWKDVVQEDA